MYEYIEVMERAILFDDDSMETRPENKENHKMTKNKTKKMDLAASLVLDFLLLRCLGNIFQLFRSRLTEVFPRTYAAKIGIYDVPHEYEELRKVQRIALVLVSDLEHVEEFLLKGALTHVHVNRLQEALHLVPLQFPIFVLVEFEIYLPPFLNFILSELRPRNAVLLFPQPFLVFLVGKLPNELEELVKRDLTSLVLVDLGEHLGELVALRWSFRGFAELLEQGHDLKNRHLPVAAAVVGLEVEAKIGYLLFGEAHAFV